MERKRRRKHRDPQEGPVGTVIPVAPLTKSAKEVIRDNRRRVLITCVITAVLIVFCTIIAIGIARLLKL